ncbi:cation diffusion facilitator family transporter [Polymorphospora sp. NPDC050346]|uniref:cation diffusion facilitator family transporter n=1 Tax=Polymorphospora sp. NPDC050346 TaxID=3155780 RepID=UPI0033C8FC53
MARPGEGTESAGTVILAGLANLGVAVAKLVAGLVSGSAAMLSEAAHSFADTVTEVLLYTAVRRGTRGADSRHPFGHGKESYVWAFLAAVFTFVGGAGFAITHGVNSIRSGTPTSDFTLSYLVLVIAFVLEAISLGRAALQVRRAAKPWGVTMRRYLSRTADTAVKAVFLEDSAALLGLVLAAAGLGLTQATGNELWDGVASIAIGLLLLVVATILARSNITLLVGHSAPGRLRSAISTELSAIPVVDRVSTLLTMQLGPHEILVAAKIDFADVATGAEIEAAADEAERRLLDVHPSIRYVFLDPTGSRVSRRDTEEGG